MSRYTFSGNQPHLRIVVGWDRPLRTYFAQVWDGGELGAGALVLWAGAGPDRVQTVEDLADLLAPHGEIPDAVVAQLRDELGEECERRTPYEMLFGK